MLLHRIILLFSFIMGIAPLTAAKDVVAEKILYAENIRYLNFTANEDEQALYKKHLILAVTQIKDIHLNFIDSFNNDPTVQQIPQRVLSLRTQIEFLKDDEYIVKAVIFDEKTKSIIKRVSSKPITKKNILKTLDQALKIVSEAI